MSIIEEDVNRAIGNVNRILLREAVFSIHIGDPVNLDTLAGAIDRLLDSLDTLDQMAVDYVQALADQEVATEREDEWKARCEHAADLLAVEVDAWEQMEEPMSPKNVAQVIATLRKGI